MATEVDRLEVVVQAEAKKANAELDKLITKLTAVSTAMNGLNTGGLQELSSGIRELSSAMQSMNGVKTTDFTRLASNINKIGKIDQPSLYKTANALRNFTNTVNSLGPVSDSAVKLSEVANGISKLGGANVTRAITNLPLLSLALKEFMTTLSTAPAVSQNIINMTNAMANLSSQGYKYGSTINSIAKAQTAMTRTQNTAAKSSQSLTAQISKLIAAYFTLKQALSFVGSSIKSSMDYTETVNLFQTSFKKIGMETASEMGMNWGSATADAYAKGFITEAQNFNNTLVNALGLDPEMMMKYQAVFAQMSNSMGLISDSSVAISESFTMLGTDIASLWNIDIDTAMTKLQSGLAGQIRPLRELGVDISKTSLEMTAYKYGITDSVEKMSQAAKVQLRWLSVMDQTEVAFGDMAKTINSPANELRVLDQQWNNLSRSLGNVFMPTVSALLPYITGMTMAIRAMLDTIASSMGYEIPDYSDSSIYTDLTGDIEGMEDATNDATDATKALKREVMSFDALNILGNKKSKSSESKSGSGYSVLDDAIKKKTDSYMARFNEQLANMSNEAKDIAENIQSFFQVISDEVSPTTTALKKLWDEGLSDLAGFTSQGAIDFFQYFLLPVGKWTLSEGLPDLFNTLNDFLTEIDFDQLNDAWRNLDKALAPFAISVGEGLIGFIDTTADILTPAVNLAIDGLSLALNGIADVIDALPEEAVEAIGGGIGGLVTALLLFNGAKTVSDTIGKITDAFKDFNKFVKANPLLITAAAIGAVVGALAAYNKAKFDSSELGLLLEHIEDVVEASKDWNAETKTMLDNYSEKNKDIEAEYGAIDILSKKYLALADETNRTNGENELMKSYAQELIEKVPELSGLIDKETGAYKGTREEIQACIDKSKEYYLVRAAEDSLVDIAKSQYEAEKNLRDLEDSRKEAIQNLDDAQSKYSQALRTGYQKDILTYRGEVEKCKTALEDIDTQIGTTKDTQLKLNKQWDYATDYITTYSTTAGTEMGKVKTAVNNALTDVAKAVKDFKLPELKLTTRLLLEIAGADTSDLAGILSDEYKIQTKADGGLIKRYAVGGMPGYEELFIAREAGPELVGRIGNQSGVMNNDQIITSVSQGVAGAVASVLIPAISSSGGSQSIEVPLYLDGEELARGVYKGMQRHERRMGKVIIG